MNNAQIEIRRMREGDLMPLLRLLSDARVMEHLEPPFDLEKTKLFLENAGLCDPPLIWAVDLNGCFAGYAIYHRYDENSMEIGWVLLPEFWGRGLASALTKRLIERAFAEGKSAVIECAPEQKATKRIAEKFAFRYAGSADGCAVYRLGKDEKTDETPE